MATDLENALRVKQSAEEKARDVEAVANIREGGNKVERIDRVEARK